MYSSEEIDSQLWLCVKSLRSFLVDCGFTAAGMAMGENVPSIFQHPHDTHYLEVKFMLFLLILYSFLTSLQFSQGRSFPSFSSGSLQLSSKIIQVYSTLVVYIGFLVRVMLCILLPSPTYRDKTYDKICDLFLAGH